jgi:hypothetical protein
MGNRDSHHSNKVSLSSHFSNDGLPHGSLSHPKSGLQGEQPTMGVFVDPSTDARVELNIEAKDLFTQSKYKQSRLQVSEMKT